MVHYSLLEIQRVIMHRILPKVGGREHTEVDGNNSLITLDENIKRLIINRLVDSCGKQGKSFELTIEKDGEESCFSKICKLSSLPDEQYIETSKEIAQLLADAQDSRISIPGGYFLLIQAKSTLINNNVYVIIKAEKQDALSEVGHTVQAMQNIFLSPAQKLFKAGVFEQISNADVLTKENFRGYLFDSQFNDGTRLAEYFYKDFLGLSIDGHGNVQTKLFYDLFMDTIDSVYKSDYEKRNACKELLQSELANQQNNLNAHESITRIIPLEKRDTFIAKVGGKFPASFVKDTTLITKKLSSRSVLLADAVRLYAPTELFLNEDIIISTDPENPEYKLIKVKIHGNN